jgi:sporulation protein YlmC with PRC-barrel domain
MAVKSFPIRNLLNNGVVNDNGESLGRIDEFMFDIETGRITYAILSFREFPGKNKYYAVPWELLDYSNHDKKFILNVPKDTISKGPGYGDMGKLLESLDTYWLSDKYPYFSRKPEWEQKREQERQEELKRVQLRRDEVRTMSHPPVEAEPISK